MPYIHPVARPEITKIVQELEDKIHGVGGLNFAITTLLINFLYPNPSYSDYNEVIGVLECAKLELYRRAVAGYEDLAKQRNGDVYDEIL